MRKTKKSGFAQKGFTLLELLISMTIGAMVVSSAFVVYIQMIKVDSVIQAELNLQSNGYFINQTLRQFVNQAGYRPLTYSAFNEVTIPIKTKSQSFPASLGSGSAGSSVTEWNEGELIRLNSDGFSFRFEGSSNSSGVADGSIINCQGESIPSGVVEELRFTLLNGAFSCTSSAGVVDLVSADEEIEVEQLVLRWGLDTDNDLSVDEYRLASAPLATGEDVKSVRFSILLSSVDEVDSANTNYFFDGVEYTSTDKRRRHELTTTVQLKH